MNDSMLARVNVLLLTLVAEAAIGKRITMAQVGEIGQVMETLLSVYATAMEIVAESKRLDKKETIN